MPKRKRKPRNYFGRRSSLTRSTFNDAADHVDAELLIQAEELASIRENTAVPGRAAVNRAVREILEERRKRNAQAEAIAAIGEDAGLVFGGAEDGSEGGRVLDDFYFPEDDG